MQIRIQVLLIGLTAVLATARSEAHSALPNQLPSPAAISRPVHVMLAEGGNIAPEPSSAALLGMGVLAGLVYIRRRKG